MGMIGNAPVAGTIGTGNIQDGGVETADIKDGAVTTAKHADLSVTNAKMAVGAAVANIGYTPVNKAGDTMSGNLKVQVFGNATSSVQYGNGLEAKMGAYAAETNVELPSPSVMFKIRARAGAVDTLGLTATYSSTERDGLLVDYLGRVSQPNQPVFGGKFSGSTVQAGSINPIKYDTVYANQGSHYSTSTGLFTVPVAGVYLAIVQSLNNNIGGYYAMQLTMGSGVAANSWSVTDNNVTPTVQSMVILQATKTLAQGDTIYVSMVTSKSSNYMAETYNTLSVIKVA